jgi:hypothetical protein
LNFDPGGADLMFVSTERLIILAVAAALFVPADADGATNIDPAHSVAWGANIGWIDWRGDSTAGAVVGEFVCSGFIYGANVGWIQLGDGTPDNGIRYQNNSATDFGVNHDQFGNLRGLAYGANIGWIQFEDSGAPRVDLRTGQLSGRIYGANVGWISFDGSEYFLKVTNIAAAADTDNDGIPDAWELLHGTNLSAMNRTTDRDGDGASDVEEYLADTNPADPADRFGILNFTQSGLVSLLSWPTKSTRNYVLQSRSDFEVGTVWKNVSPGPLIGTGNILTGSVTNSLAEPHLFFRIQSFRPLMP